MTGDLHRRLMAASPMLDTNTGAARRVMVGRGVAFAVGILLGFVLARITSLIVF